MAERTAIIKPRIADIIWTPAPKDTVKLEKKANAEAAIPDIGCVMCWNIRVQWAVV